MTILQFGAILLKNGYQHLENVKPEEFKIFYQNLNNRIIAVLVLDFKENSIFERNDFFEVQKKVRKYFGEGQDIQVFSVVFASNIDTARKFIGKSSECWIYDTIKNRTLIYDNQPSNFYGLYQMLETEVATDASDEFSYKNIKKTKEKVKKRPVVTLGLIVLNLIVFLILEILGNTEDAEFMAMHGALYAPFISDGQEYYRLFTAMFMHFGINHLLNNMVMLFCVGEILEKQIGKIPYGIIYLVSGIGANVVSLWYYVKNEEFPVSAGASGAVFGIVGALLVAVIMNRGKLESVTTSRMLVMISLSLYLGFTDVTTNNLAHIGGLIVGILLGIIFIPIALSKRKKN